MTLAGCRNCYSPAHEHYRKPIKDRELLVEAGRNQPDGCLSGVIALRMRVLWAYLPGRVYEGGNVPLRIYYIHATART